MKTEIIKVNPEYPDFNKIAHCARVIRQGGLVVFPTETVYGIAADLSNPQAMTRLRDVKKRSEGKPFSVLISQRGLIANYTPMNEPRLYKLIDAFWPGPLTIVVPSREPNETVGIRMPDHLIALRLVQESQCTIAAPSANREGLPPPSTCEEALRELDGLVDVAIDGGNARWGKGSSVVDLTQEKATLLRQGVISQEDIDQIVNKKTILFVCTGNSCRSVMAEYLLKSMVFNRMNVEVISSGTGVFINSAASNETISVLKEEGIDCSKHQSQPLTSIMLKKADLIFVMTRAHRQQVLERVPEVEKRVYLLREFAQNPTGYPIDLDIPDPIGRPHHEYKGCFSIIKEAVMKIVDLI